jgi:hypothetical protein
VATVTEAVLPSPAFRPGGLTRLLAWIDGLPFHGWWFFPLAYVVLFAYSHAIVWAAGIVPVGKTNQFLLAGEVYGPYMLATIAYTNQSAKRALDTFWPATGWPDADRASWRHAFITSPARLGLPTFVVALVVTVLSYGSASSSMLTELGASVDGNDRLIVFVAYLPVGLTGYWAGLLAIAHTVRQLRLVARIHREARNIDPFDRAPVYAFSGLTVRTGLAYVLLGYYSLAANGAFLQGNVATLAVLLGVFILGVACFILPLLGIHGRLVQEKELLLREVEVRLRRLGDEMYRRVDAGQFDQTKPVGDSIAGVSVLRDRIARLPTWPWPPNVLRGFVTALLLPVIVYVASRLIGGQVGV